MVLYLSRSTMNEIEIKKKEKKKISSPTYNPNSTVQFCHTSVSDQQNRRTIGSWTVLDSSAQKVQLNPGENRRGGAGFVKTDVFE